MSKLSFERNIRAITIEDCLECMKIGIAVYMDEGRKITLEDED